MHKLPQPGPLLVSIDLKLSREGEIELESLFQSASVAMAYLDGRTALAATDFAPDPEGFVRFVVVDLRLTPIRAGSLVQRLLELETYRMFALLGLPEAQRLAPDVGAIERDLAVITVAMTQSQDDVDSHDLLQQLTSLAARLEAGAMASLYRFSASRAYSEIVQGRLETIQEEPFPGYSTFSGFMSRRLDPAMRTCKAMEDRQENLSLKVARAAQLLRTRVDIELEHQNRDLLTSMNARTRLQLRLQETVEILSIAAASYYLVGLIGHLTAALPALGIAVGPEVATAITVPFVVAAVGVFFFVRLRAVKEHGGGGPH
jgi:uncharacterized membrane-anchored protein